MGLLKAIKRRSALKHGLVITQVRHAVSRAAGLWRDIDAGKSLPYDDTIEDVKRATRRLLEELVESHRGGESAGDPDFHYLYVLCARRGLLDPEQAHLLLHLDPAAPISDCAREAAEQLDQIWSEMYGCEERAAGAIRRELNLA